MKKQGYVHRRGLVTITVSSNEPDVGHAGNLADMHRTSGQGMNGTGGSTGKYRSTGPIAQSAPRRCSRGCSTTRTGRNLIAGRPRVRRPGQGNSCCRKTGGVSLHMAHSVGQEYDCAYRRLSRRSPSSLLVRGSLLRDTLIVDQSDFHIVSS